MKKMTNLIPIRCHTTRASPNCSAGSCRIRWAAAPQRHRKRKRCRSAPTPSAAADEPQRPMRRAQPRRRPPGSSGRKTGTGSCGAGCGSASVPGRSTNSYGTMRLKRPRSGAKLTVKWPARTSPASASRRGRSGSHSTLIPSWLGDL